LLGRFEYYEIDRSKWKSQLKWFSCRILAQSERTLMFRSQRLEHEVKACSRCDNAGSGEHLEYVAGEWFCEGCLALAIKRAKRQILRSRRVVVGMLLLGIGFGIFVATTAPNRKSAGLDIWLLGCLEWLGNVYAAWSMYWGIPVVWNWWLRRGRSLGKSPLSRLLPPVPLILVFYIPFIIGCMYGFLGGGVYEYAKCRKVAALQDSGRRLGPIT